MKSGARLDALMSPGRIGSLDLRNRIVMTPMGSNLAEPDGHLSQRIIRYYEERARGGAGLLIVGVGAVAYPAGACNPNQVAISSDDYLPGLQELSERVHRHDCRIAIQLQHAGKVATRDMVVGRPMLVPSIPPRKFGDLMNEMTPEEAHLFTRDFKQKGSGIFHHEATEEDLARVVDQFAQASDRALRAGFDAVELHAGHGYLISSFLSPSSNQREDQYGGSLENRARLLVEILRASKAQVSSRVPIWCRIDAIEYRTENGIVFEDALKTAELAEEAGADAIHVSAYADSTSGVAFTDAPLVDRPSGFVDFARGVKKQVDIPVIAVGRIEPEEADQLIANGQADFIAMGRKLLADPELPRKLDENRPQDIRPCIYCYTCVGEIFLNRASRCAVNPASGREAEMEILPAATSRHVLVVGGGPAGMEAARILSLRGHRVTLCEKGKHLGGTAYLSALVYPPNGRLVAYLENQVESLPIDLRMEQEVSSEFVQVLAPDTVVVAVGAVRAKPEIPGIDARHVLSGDDLRELLAGGGGDAARQKLTLAQRAMVGMGGLLGLADNLERTRELTRHYMPLGKEVAILGGGLVGVELAEFLAERGRRVVVIEEGKSLAPEMAMPRRWRVLHELAEHGVEILRECEVLEITATHVAVSNKEGKRHDVSCQSVIVASGIQANRPLYDALSELPCDVRIIGDADRVGYIDGAMSSAARIAHEI